MTGGDFTVVSVNASSRKGERKTPRGEGILVEGKGLEGDAHAGVLNDGVGHRQISLLALEDIETMRAAFPSLGPGDFAENITTRGVELSSLPLGARIVIGEAELEVSQIGKACHGEKCEIYKKAGDCVMPRKGIFARVIKGGRIRNEDRGHYRIG